MSKLFLYEEDAAYFENLLQEFGGLVQHHELFDFRDPKSKRAEFNKIRSQVFQELIATFGSICQLKCHADCTNTGEVVDHLIPLSSNVLNKQLRGLCASDGKKAPTQSFGSNHPNNFVLSCKRCNSYKMNKMPTLETLKQVFAARSL